MGTPVLRQENNERTNIHTYYPKHKFLYLVLSQKIHETRSVSAIIFCKLMGFNRDHQR